MGLFNLARGWLSRPRRFLAPRPLDAVVYYDNHSLRIMLGLGDLPRVMLVTDKMLRQWDPEMPTLEELGYEMYDRSTTMRASYYARGPWLWLLRTWVRADRTFWHLVDATCGG